jgi:hypothetical protein
MGQLFGNRVMLLRLIRERGHIAEGTAATPNSAIAVWAAKTTMQR